MVKYRTRGSAARACKSWAALGKERASSISSSLWMHWHMHALHKGVMMDNRVLQAPQRLSFVAKLLKGVMVPGPVCLPHARKVVRKSRRCPFVILPLPTPIPFLPSLPLSPFSFLHFPLYLLPSPHVFSLFHPFPLPSWPLPSSPSSPFSGRQQRACPPFLYGPGPPTWGSSLSWVPAPLPPSPFTFHPFTI